MLSEEAGSSRVFAQMIRGAKLTTQRRWQGVEGKKWMGKSCHSTAPFEGLRVLSKVEGLMALSKTLSEVEGSRIEGLAQDIS